MRIPLYLITGFLILVSFSYSQEDAEPKSKQSKGQAWLGIDLSKPTDFTTVHLPSLPPGIGFVISGVKEGGPAEKAGIKKLDLLWKMDDQWLVNEGQLATLLRIASPESAVTLSVYREGKNIDFEVTLGALEETNEDIAQQELMDSVIRIDDGMLRIVNVGEDRAVISNEKGTAEMVRTPQGDSLRIQNSSGEIIFDGFIQGRMRSANLSEEWQKEVCAMRRSLDHAKHAAPAAARVPRPRIIVPPEPVSPPK